jgi:hypothetical protein
MDLACSAHRGEEKCKAKAFPLHAMKALVGERRYTSSFSTSVQDGVSGQRHAPVAL